jgi:Leucine-rich repeat (LRR) protein
LADNHIRKLPVNMVAMAQITELNLNGNPIDDLIAAVDTLKTMPNLKSLQINLHEEEQVDYLLRTLTDLELLNGLAVEREALFNEEEDGEEEQEEDQPYTSQ